MQKLLPYVIIGLLCTILTTFSFTVTCYACNCAINSVEAEYENSSAIFSGKVIQLIDENKNKKLISTGDQITVILEVQEVWKGVNESQIMLHTVRSSASCGYEFEIGKEYLIYATEREQGFHVSSCSRTTTLSHAISDIDYLGEGNTPTEQITLKYTAEGQISPISSPRNIFLKSIIVVVLFISLAGYLHYQRKKDTT